VRERALHAKAEAAAADDADQQTFLLCLLMLDIDRTVDLSSTGPRKRDA
jgi:hypothetical protein